MRLSHWLDRLARALLDPGHDDEIPRLPKALRKRPTDPRRWN